MTNNLVGAIFIADMKEHILVKCAKILIKDWAGNKARPTFHYAFAIKKNKIIAIGKNKPDFPSQLAAKLARLYKIEKWVRYPYLHAETDLLQQLQPDEISKQIEILNLRINRHGQFRFCKPCINCQKVLDTHNLHKISWSKNLPEDNPKIIMIDGYQQTIVPNPFYAKLIQNNN